LAVTRVLTHAIVIVSGEPEARFAFRERVVIALSAEYPEVLGEARETEASLVFDLKVEHGIPFPPFVSGSEAYPDLTVRVEWADAENKGYAELKGGKIVGQANESLAGEEVGAAYIAVKAGALDLALTLLSSGGDEVLGYAITSDQDALFRLTRNRDRAELYCSAGTEPNWEERWAVDLKTGSFVYSPLDPPQPMDAALFEALTRHALKFARAWLWLASAPLEETIIERHRFEQAGYTVGAANVKYEKLKTLGSEPGKRLEASTLKEEQAWIKDVIERCWARES
jgi:hypothetical protein